MTEFILGIRTPLSTTSMPASARTTSNNSGNLPSRIRYRARQPVSSRSMTRFFAACTTHAVDGCGVAPRIRIRRLACSITANTYIRVPVRVTVSRKSHASRASAWERRKSAQVLQVRSGAGSDPGLFQDLPYGGGGHLHPQHQQVAVQPSVPPLGILAGQAQHQGADGT